jgi:hypothetical protein
MRASRRKLATFGWFSAIFFQKQHNSIFIWFTSGRLDRVSWRTSLKFFPCSNGTLEYSKILDIFRTWCHVVRMACRDFPNSVDFWNPTPCWILIDLAFGWCCSDVRTSSMFICKTLRGVQTPSKARPDGCTGTVVRTWKLHGIFMDIFLETCDHTHGMKWDTVHITWRLWIEPIILLKATVT